MTELPRRGFLSLTGGVAMAGSLASLDRVALAAPARDLADPPRTIPALQSWTAAAGQFTLPQAIRILVSPADAGQLGTAADVLAEDLRKLTRRPASVVVDDQPTAGDVVLRLAAIPGLNAEGYELEVGSAMTVRGARQGVFWGTRTIVQWLRQTTTIPAGTARDWPRYPDRGLLVANAARHYSMTWWQGQIQEMSYLKMGMLWIYAGYDSAPLSELKAIAAYAAKYNVALVPQFNMPGHMRLGERPDLQLAGRPGDLDLGKDAAYEFGRSQIGPLLGEFSTPHWHLGADEYLVDFTGDIPVRYDLYPHLAEYAKQRFGPSAVAPDVFRGFVNDMNATVRGGGKTLRMWNDGFLTAGTVPIDKNVVIEHWVSWPNRKTPQQLANEGYKLSNSNGDFLYYDPGIRRPEPQPLYENFRLGLFSGGQTVSESSPALVGAKLHLWTLPLVETEQFQSDRLMEPLRVLSQVLWGSPKPSATYAGFAPLITTVGRPPGFPILRHSTDPVEGATSVVPTRPVKVKFFDAVDPNRIQLSVGSPEASVPGRVTYDAASRTATFTPNQPLSWATTYPVTLMAWDPAGNPLPAPHHWTFRTATKPSTYYPRSIWFDTDAPAIDTASDGISIELGLKFRTDVDGTVLGVRYFKGAENIGRHDGTLWTASGTRLATATFTNESAAGWQEVRFATPVRIRANTTHVVSYNSSHVYAGTVDTFVSAGKRNGVLQALQSGVDGGNGLFRYGYGFPTETYRGSNYWVDVVFQPDTLSIWDVNDVPAVPNATEQRTLELGVKFQSEVAGSILGIRYYKGSSNIATHVGTLWSRTGTKLASATFTNESASGWQEVRFASPVPIDPGVTYVASYSAPTGVYAGTNDVFATSGKDNGPLHALRTGVDGGNGVFAMEQGVFPSMTYRASNYFADIAFKAG